MASTLAGDLLLADLIAGIPRVSATITSYFAEACIMCLDNQKHKSGVSLVVEGITSATFQVLWDTPITEDMLLGWGDEATENGAYALAFLLMRHLTEYPVIRRARTGTGIDFWLAYERPNNILEDAARLEVSGILRGNRSSINSRVATKKGQTKPTDGTLPVYIIVVEFGRPVAQVVLK